MQLSFDGGAHLLDHHAQGSLVSMGGGDVEITDLNGGDTVAGLRSGCNYSIGTLVK